jgi:hypothetical protein
MTTFPLHFTLDSGTRVIVNKIANNTFEFNLKPEAGPAHQFTYVDDGRTKTEAEEGLNFEQIDALREFWLETEDIG